MKIDILNTSDRHPINNYLEKFKSEFEISHSVSILRSSSELSGGDILFLISCNEKLKKEKLDLYDYRFVLHASDLPKGRGWSPHIWDIINGANDIWLSLIDVADEIDTGDIYFKLKIEVSKSALWDEINHLIFNAEIQLMKYAVEHHGKLEPSPQSKEIEASYYKKRTPNDSEIDPTKSLIDQFDLIRVCDPNRFPAFFELNGVKYKIILEKA